jgi:hypothetical protein
MPESTEQQRDDLESRIAEIFVWYESHPPTLKVRYSRAQIDALVGILKNHQSSPIRAVVYALQVLEYYKGGGIEWTDAFICRSTVRQITDLHSGLFLNRTMQNGYSPPKELSALDRHLSGLVSARSASDNSKLKSFKKIAEELAQRVRELESIIEGMNKQKKEQIALMTELLASNSDDLSDRLLETSALIKSIDTSILSNKSDLENLLHLLKENEVQISATEEALRVSGSHSHESIESRIKRITDAIDDLIRMTEQ